MKTIYFIPLLLLLLSLNHDSTAKYSPKMEFWMTQKKGTNGNLTVLRKDWFENAKTEGFHFIRFNVTWLKAEEKDFLIGEVDCFRGINRNDLELLFRILDTAHEHNQKIVLTMMELPGCRYVNEGGDPDYRIWQDEAYQKQAFDFWRELAGTVKDHPAIVAYNPLNEPHPELAYGYEQANRDFKRWLEDTEGTTNDLNLFNRNMVAAIRIADPDTPIILDGYFYADPMGMPYLEVINDPNILYAFHNPVP
jgi:hypothetical protein